MTELLVDCTRCVARPHACSDCVVSVLLGVPDRGQLTLAPDEREALATMAESGLVPPLRLVVGLGGVAV